MTTFTEVSRGLPMHSEGNLVPQDIRPGPDSPEFRIDGSMTHFGNRLFFVAYDVCTAMNHGRPMGRRGHRPPGRLHRVRRVTYRDVFLLVLVTYSFSSAERCKPVLILACGDRRHPGGTRLLKIFEACWVQSSARFSTHLVFAATTANMAGAVDHDGTAEGTVLLKDFGRGRRSGRGAPAWDDHVLFTADDGEHAWNVGSRMDSRGYERFLKDVDRRRLGGGGTLGGRPSPFFANDCEHAASLGSSMAP